MTATITDTPHPAPFSPILLDRMGVTLRRLQTAAGYPLLAWDPFAGTGRVHKLSSYAPGLRIIGTELEYEWARQRPGAPQAVADILHPPFRSASINGIITSPCLEQGHRLLTDDLRWVAAGDVQVGDGLMAFDEESPGFPSGIASRRHWDRATVLRSEPKLVPGVRVILANGDEILTTPEHPWLAHRYGYGGRSEWVASQDLVRKNGSPYYVNLQVRPWRQRRSYDAGWLAGMFDGEGSLSLSVHGSPKLCMYQTEGAVMDRAERLMESFGYAPNRITRPAVGERQKVANLYVTGGFPGMMTALGELRPTRLLEKWKNLDLTTRTVQAEKVEVLAIEPAGLIEIQEITTSTGTYIGEGYLHHNCYGNRFADHHKNNDLCKTCSGEGVKDGRICRQCKGRRISRRRSYTHDLGRDVTAGSAAIMQWGPAYRDFHTAAFTEALRYLRPPRPLRSRNLRGLELVGAQQSGWLLLNISDHYRQKKLQAVTDWYVTMLGDLGLIPALWDRIPTQRMKEGENSEARVPFENLILFRAA